MGKTKICSKCGEELPLTDEYFQVRKDGKDGFRNQCRKCTGTDKRTKQPSDENFRICPKCLKELPANTDFFHSDKSRKNGLASWCKECVNFNAPKSSRTVVSIEYDGETFTKDKKTGYYLSSKPIYNNKRILLHRYVWIKNNGKIPKGYVVHHIDENKDNNDISNFELMTNYEHSKMHGDKIFKENKEEILKRFAKSHSKKILKKIKEKNKTPRKKEWYIKQAAYIKSLGIYDKTETLICQYCGQEFKTTKLCADKTKYCSGKCADKARAESGIDDIERICVICGKLFIINKRKVRQTCSEECKYVLRAKSREKNKNQ